MKFIPHNLYHVYNQGNNKQQVFFDDDDYLTFIRLMRSLILPHTDIVAYCLMPNHFHLMIYTDDRIATLKKQGSIMIDPLSNGIRKLLSGYARINNKKYNKSGSVFRQKTKSKLLSDDLIIDGTNLPLADYCWKCFIYIHQNPFKAKLIKRHEDWAFSSYLDFGGMRNGTICNKELASKYCSYSSETFLNDMMKDIDAGDFYFSY